MNMRTILLISFLLAWDAPLFAQGAQGRDILKETLSKVDAMKMEALPEEERVALSLKNPFLPQIPRESKIETPPQQQARTAAPSGAPQASAQSLPRQLPPQFVVSGLVWNTKRPQAIINGQIVSIGDRVNAWSVESISRDGIQVRLGTEIMLLKPWVPGAKDAADAGEPEDPRRAPPPPGLR